MKKILLCSTILVAPFLMVANTSAGGYDNPDSWQTWKQDQQRVNNYALYEAKQQNKVNSKNYSNGIELAEQAPNRLTCGGSVDSCSGYNRFDTRVYENKKKVTNDYSKNYYNSTISKKKYYNNVVPKKTNYYNVIPKNTYVPYGTSNDKTEPVTGYIPFIDSEATKNVRIPSSIKDRNVNKMYQNKYGVVAVECKDLLEKHGVLDYIDRRAFSSSDEYRKYQNCKTQNKLNRLQHYK